MRFQVFSVRPASRTGPDGQLITEIVVEIIQSRKGYLDPVEQDKADNGSLNKEPDFILRGGCTLLLDPSTGFARYCIYKKMESENRLVAMRKYQAREDDASLQMTYFGDPRHNYYREYIQSESMKKESGYESFAFLHRSYSPVEVAQ